MTSLSRCSPRLSGSGSASCGTHTTDSFPPGSPSSLRTRTVATWLRDAIRVAFDYPVVNGIRTGLISFRDAFDYVTGDDPVALRDAHWLPQCAFLHPDLISYDVIGRFENFADDFRRIFEHLEAPSNVLAMAETRYNATYDSEFRDCYDAALADRVHAFYAEDFDSFNYAADSWAAPLT